ncbi:MAG TPA: diguanylate cyclase [Nitrospirota bacterium]|nr:diguanylate cyclase [Nitrospirota bacterium]
MRIKTILEFPGKLPKPFLTLIGFLLVLAIGSLDSITSYDISIATLYLLPIILIAWFEGGVPAALISIFSAITWAVSDLISGHPYSHIAVPIWNATMVLGMFLIVSYSIAAIKKLLIKEHEHAYTDDLTGVANIRSFYEQARTEIGRSATSKQPLTLAYIDIDNLRHINDTLGHIAGDYLLHEAAQTLRATLRSADIISRLGGSKFAILMPGTKNEDATVVIYNVQEHLLDMVGRNGWPVTFSTGVVTCDDPTYTIDILIKKAEDLMNAAKETGKNIVQSKILDFSSTAS